MEWTNSYLNVYRVYLNMTGFEIAILFIIVYWLFGPRVIAMVDALSTRAKTVYDTWNLHRDRQPDLSMLSSVRRQVAFKRQQRELTIAQGRDTNLAAIKSCTWSGFPQKPRKLLRGPCTACDATLQVRSTDESSEDDVINLLETKEANSSNWLVRTFSDIVHNYNAPKYAFAQIQDTVLTDERVQDAISETVSAALSEADGEVTEEAYARLLAKYSRKAKGVVKYMHAAMSNVMLQITSYVMYKLLPRCLSSVCLHPSQVEIVKKAELARVPIVYVPLHRSHLDYVLLILSFFNSNLRPPLTAAGMNLNMPFFGTVLRWLGGFYIKRRIDPVSGGKDLIYRAALHSYMVQCLKAGHNIKFFIEGGRTRTGRPLLPKGGLLSVIVDALMDGAVEDVLLVPVSVNYDRLVDGNFVQECLGQPKEKETFTMAMKAIWSTLNSSHGSCSVNFNQPFSLKELIKSFQSDVKMQMGATLTSSGSSSSSLHGIDIANDDRRHVVEHIANHLVYDCADVSAMMSTNVVAWLLTTKFRGGVRMGTLVHMVDRLREDLHAQRRPLGFTGSSVDVTNSALKLLGPGLVKREQADGASEWDELITPVTYLPNVIELSYYANALLPQYILPCVVTTSAFSLMKDDPDKKVGNVLLREPEMMKRSLELCDILQYEFVFNRPCQSLETILYQAVNDICNKGIFSSIRPNAGRDNLNFGYDEDDEDDEGPVTFYKVSTCEETMEELVQYTAALRPLLDTYIVTATMLNRLVRKQISESDFLRDIIDELKTHLQTGYCLYGESCNVDPIKNACKLLKKWGVLESFTKDSVRIVYLTEKYDNRPAIAEIVERLSKYKFTDLCSS